MNNLINSLALLPKLAVILALILSTNPLPAFAVEGSSAAGPIGGTDVRSAQLPPPGVYAAGIATFGEAFNFFDGNGDRIPAFDDLSITPIRGAAAALYVPDFQIFNGSIGLTGVLPFGQTCGQTFAVTGSECLSGIGDPYVELSWSRFFGKLRPSKHENAFPIAEGLTVQLGLGVVIPVGAYDVDLAQSNGVTLGNNIWDFAPITGFTYTTSPIFSDGTEISARFYLNNYLTNPDTEFSTGSLLNVDFAVTEKIGRFQAGLTGVYIKQVEDDRLFGIPLENDGNRAETLSLGLIGVYDLPKKGMSIKLKGVTTVFGENVPDTYGISLSFVKKLF